MNASFRFITAAAIGAACLFLIPPARAGGDGGSAGIGTRGYHRAKAMTGGDTTFDTRGRHAVKATTGGDAGFGTRGFRATGTAQPAKTTYSRKTRRQSAVHRGRHQAYGGGGEGGVGVYGGRSVPHHVSRTGAPRP